MSNTEFSDNEINHSDDPLDQLEDQDFNNDNDSDDDADSSDDDIVVDGESKKNKRNMTQAERDQEFLAKKGSEHFRNGFLSKFYECRFSFSHHKRVGEYSIKKEIQSRFSEKPFHAPDLVVAVNYQEPAMSSSGSELSTESSSSSNFKLGKNGKSKPKPTIRFYLLHQFIFTHQSEEWNSIIRNQMQAFHSNDPNALDLTQKQNAHLVKDSKTIPVIDLTKCRVKMACFDKIVDFLYTGNLRFLKKDFEDMMFTAEDSKLDFVKEAFQYIINNQDDCLVVGKTDDEIKKEIHDKKKKNYERNHRNDQNNKQNQAQNNNTNSASKFKRNLSKNSHQRQQNYNNHRHQNRPNKKRSNNGSTGVTRQGMSALLTMLGQAMGGK